MVLHFSMIVYNNSIIFFNDSLDLTYKRKKPNLNRDKNIEKRR